jgi:hypothetical protein
MKKVAIVNLAALFLLAGFFCAGNVPVAKALDSANASANVVIGQPDFTSNSGNQGGTDSGANKTYWPNGAWTDGKKLIFADIRNNRVLIYNSIPVSNNASADVVIGQADFTSHSANQGNASPGANTLSGPYSVSSDGTRLFVADAMNNRVLIYNTIPTSNNASADVVIGQADFTGNNENQGGSAAANTLDYPYCVHTDGTKLIVSDASNNRVLIYNSIPTGNNASADVVIGQQNMTSNSENQGGAAAAANTLFIPYAVYSDGDKLFIADSNNNRVLIYNHIPTSNNASADVVVGQQNMTSSDANQGGSVAANTLSGPVGVYSDGIKLIVSDGSNSRVLVYNTIPTSNNASADVVIGQANMTSGTASSAAANTMGAPSEVYAFGNKLAVTDRMNSRALVYNSIPTENGAGASVVLGQENTTADDADRGGAAAANTLDEPRGLTFGGTKMFVGDTGNSRVLIYDAGPQYAIGKNQSANLWNGEKMKVKKKKFEFSGTRATLKKGKVRLLVNGTSKKLVKIKKSGKWKIKYNHKTNETVRLRFKFYNSSSTNVENPETYVVQVSHSGTLTPVTLKRSNLEPRILKSSESGAKKSEKIDMSEISL